MGDRSQFDLLVAFIAVIALALTALGVGIAIGLAL